MEPSTPWQQPETPPHAENKSLLIQYGKWTLMYMYQFAVVNPLLAVLIALLIVVLFALVIPVIFLKLFIF